MPAELCELTVRIDTGRWSETVLDAVDLVVPDGAVTALLREAGCGTSMAAAALTGSPPAAPGGCGAAVRRCSGGASGGACAAPSGWSPRRAPRPSTSRAPWASNCTPCMSGTAAGASSWPARPPATRPGCPACTPDRRSGGQIKRAALADALPPARRVRVACGPAASLGTATACGVRTTLRRYADAGAAVLAITHDVPMPAAAGSPTTWRSCAAAGS